MFMMFINRGEANIETLPLNIFVFVNKVLIKLYEYFCQYILKIMI